MKSAIYKGTVFHSRKEPKENSFSYPVYMAYLDLDELDTVFSLTPLWKQDRRALVSFNRRDFFDGDDGNLKDSVANKVEQELGFRPAGPIRLLANLRTFGYLTNPIACYYCYSENEELLAVVAEVTNTPWGDRCHYVIPGVDTESKIEHTFDKSMHVSPFMEMDMSYLWSSSTPNQSLAIALKNIKHGRPIFSASLSLQREEISRENLNRVCYQYPLSTLSIITKIYWQALKVFIKGVPFVGKKKTVKITNPL